VCEMFWVFHWTTLDVTRTRVRTPNNEYRITNEDVTALSTNSRADPALCRQRIADSDTVQLSDCLTVHCPTEAAQAADLLNFLLSPSKTASGSAARLPPKTRTRIRKRQALASDSESTCRRALRRIDYDLWRA